MFVVGVCNVYNSFTTAPVEVQVWGCLDPQTTPKLAVGGRTSSRGLALIKNTRKLRVYGLNSAVLVPKPDSEYTVGGIGILRFRP